MGKLICLLALISTLVPTNCLVRDPDEPLFLSEYVLKGDYNTARNLSIVRHEEMNGVTSYAGYITLNRQLSSNMFFWYFPAEHDSSTAPLVLWLQGGPGSPSMHGLFKSNGPFVIDSDGRLKSRKHSWHLRHNLLYIDNPVGTGFSFSGYDAGYSKTQNDIGTNLYTVMQQFLSMFPELRPNPFYITGSSYAGKFAVALGTAVLRNTPTFNAKTRINLQGLAIESGFIDPVNMINYGEILHKNGMIDSNGLKIFKEHENEALESLNKRDYLQALFHIDHLILNLFYKSETVFTNLTGSTNYYNTLMEDAYDFSNVDDFMSRPDIRQAINVGPVEYQPNEFNNVHLNEEDRKVQFSLRKDIMQSMAPRLSELLKHYKVFLFNGQLDILCGYPLSESFLTKLKFNGAEEYQVAERHVWRVDNEFAGYVKQAGKLTEILVRNAGHYVSIDQPEWVLDILAKLTSGESFVEKPSAAPTSD